MAHPFFDAVSYPWARPEADPLYRALYQVFPIPQKADLLYQRCGGEAGTIDLGQPPHLIWKEVLAALTVARGLSRLCDVCLAEFAANLVLVAAAKAVVAAVPAWHRRVIADNGKKLRFDRQQLQAALDRLADPDDDARVVVVKGDPKSGKTHSRYLFELAAKERGAQVMYLRKESCATVQELVTTLVAAIGVKEPVTQFSTDPAFYRAVIQKLQVTARDTGKVWWIAMDDLGNGPDGAPLADTELRVFFKQFGVMYPDPQYRDWFRLLLIGLPIDPNNTHDMVATRWNRDCYLEDAPREVDITAAHVKETIQEWADRRGKSLAAGELDALTAGVLAKANELRAGPNPPAWLECLHTAAVTALVAL